MGIYYDGTTIYIHNDNNGTGGHTIGQPHTFAEIAAADIAGGWGVFTALGTNAASYRSQKTIQIGDKVGGTIDASGVAADTTTLSDTDSSLFFDNTKTLAWRATQTTSWNTNFGTKVGTGNIASGKSGTTLIFGATTTTRGNMSWYGSTFKITAGFLQLSNVAGTVVDIQNCLFQSSVAGVNPFVLGTASTTNFYNLDISHSTTSQVLSSFRSTSAERVTVCATAPTTFLQTAINALSVKDLKMFGSPSTSDIRWSGAGPSNWQLVRPGFTGAAPKFSAASVNPVLSAATWEYWLWDVKVVDGAGAGIANVPVKLTDATGEVQVDTVTGSDGQLMYGSGITANTVKVMDHYVTAGPTYTQRHRSPFLVEINTGASALVGLQSRRYNFYWPGYESVTTSSGSFEDVADIVSLGEPSGAATNWVEMVL